MKELKRCCNCDCDCGNGCGCCYIPKAFDVAAKNGKVSASVLEHAFVHSEDDRTSLPLSAIIQSAICANLKCSRFNRNVAGSDGGNAIGRPPACAF